MTTLKILIGLMLLGLAWIYLFRTNLIFQINAWMRENVFSDHLALFSGKRVAILLFVLGLVALFSGVRNVARVQRLPPNIAADMLDQARAHLARQEYGQVINRCKELVRTDPTSKPAWELLMVAWSATGEKELARDAAENLVRLDPTNDAARHLLNQKAKAKKVP